MRRLPLGLATATVLLATACGYSGPPASTLLQRAATTFDGTQSFHVVLSSDDVAGSGTLLTGAVGDAARPDGFTGTLDVTESGLPLQIGVVSTGGSFYARLPFTTGYVKADPSQYGFADPGRLLDPSSGISTLITGARHASVSGEVRQSGETLVQVTAQVPGTLVAALLTDADPAQSVDITYSIDPDTDQVRQVDLTGPLFVKGDQSTYHLVLDRYGENVSITPPAT
ncbi:MAG: LppX_LprAFG lipoprotein [Candidatus Dormibacteria bacterium]